MGQRRNLKQFRRTVRLAVAHREVSDIIVLRRRAQLRVYLALGALVAIGGLIAIAVGFAFAVDPV